MVVGDILGNLFLLAQRLSSLLGLWARIEGRSPQIWTLAHRVHLYDHSGSQDPAEYPLDSLARFPVCPGLEIGRVAGCSPKYMRNVIRRIHEYMFASTIS